MKTNHLILFCVLILVIVGGIATYLVLNNSQLETYFVINKINISTSDNFGVILMDENNDSLANKTVVLNILDSEGNSANYSIVTDDKGVAILSNNLNEGDYIVSGIFEGGNGYKSSSFNNINLTVYKKLVSSASSSSISSSSSDPDYDASRDASHQYATPENPITVQQDDGEYTYYGPGHYDYYGGDNHMSGEYYKERNSQ